MNYDVLKIWTIFSLSVLIKRVLITKKVCRVSTTPIRIKFDSVQFTAGKKLSRYDGATALSGLRSRFIIAVENR